MNLDIRKITNGYVVSIDGEETFCDIPEAICGHVAEWIQERCKNLEAKKPGADAEYMRAMQQLVDAQMRGAVGQPAKLIPWAELPVGKR